MPDLRAAHEDDHPALVRRVQEWWGDSRTPQEARELSLLLPRLFLQFFAGTSLVAQDASGVRAFLVGLYAADDDTSAYIHFVGVDPALRGSGVGRGLYEEFFRRAERAGRKDVRAITSPGNTGSIAFHRKLGFVVEPGDREVGGVAVREDYDGPGQHRVCFRRPL
ncbi:GNAT family N-acetyltransferase [Streptomyces sp. NBC_00483]|uniref:GNAT family N-acetyltransferase n=1 Tax=Streptomyces sp. NBC_00483 TaxID=2975756 RepID=UPI002E174EE3